MNLPERRRFVRVETPLKAVVKTGDQTDEVVTKNVSPVGLGFEIGRELKGSEELGISLYLPESGDPISIDGKVIWQRKMSLEDNAPYDIGVEIINIDDNKKNIFLKYLCDLLYKSLYETRI